MLAAFASDATLAKEISAPRRIRIQELLRTALRQSSDEAAVWRQFGRDLVEQELEEGRSLSYYQRLSRTLQEHSDDRLRLILPEPDTLFDKTRMRPVETGGAQAGRVDRVLHVKRPGIELSGEVVVRAQVRLG
jgi:hypothetical protein